MAQGRKTPTKIKKLQGTYEKCKSLENEMTPKTISANELDIPRGLVNDFAQSEWLKMTRVLDELGMLVETDTSMLLAYCNEIGTYFECMENVKENGFTQPAKGHGEIISNYIKVGNTALANAIKLSDKFGFNPASRTKIEMPQKTDGDPLDFL